MMKNCIHNNYNIHHQLIVIVIIIINVTENSTQPLSEFSEIRSCICQQHYDYSLSPCTFPS